MVYINAYGACSALGSDINEIKNNLKTLHAPGMRLTPHYLQNGNELYLGHALYEKVVENQRYIELMSKLQKRCGWDECYGISNNNKLLMASYLQVDNEFNALLKKLNVSRDRVAVIMGTSTSASAEADLKADFEQNLTRCHDTSDTTSNADAASKVANAALESSDSSYDFLKSQDELLHEYVKRISQLTSQGLSSNNCGESQLTNNDAKHSVHNEGLKRVPKLNQCNAYKAYGYTESEALKHLANYNYSMQELGDPSRFLAEVLDISGPTYTISTACSSSLRAIISAVRLIELGLCDVALAGGADTLSRMTVNGFNSMGLVSLNGICQPFAKDRAGITIGEASGIFVLSKEPTAIRIAGLGESSDAYHMSSPHPEGEGALIAMKNALAMAGIEADEIGYVNLHGTGTPMNDAVESKVMAKLCPNVPCSSTKYLTGHTLGACGIWESVLCALLLQHKDELCLPKQDFSTKLQDDEIAQISFVRDNEHLKKNYVMNNAFAFGGNNATIILEGV